MLLEGRPWTAPDCAHSRSWARVGPAGVRGTLCTQERGTNLDQHPATESLGTDCSSVLILSFFRCKLRPVPPVYLPTTQENAGERTGTQGGGRC